MAAPSSVGYRLTQLFAVSSVEEEDEISVPDENDQNVVIPINMGHPNPNGVEFDNLYLDMNGIVSTRVITPLSTLSNDPCLGSSLYSSRGKGTSYSFSCLRACSDSNVFSLPRKRKRR